MTEGPILVRVVAPHFVAGLSVFEDRVVEAAPILRYAVGWTADRLRRYVRHKGWTASRITLASQQKPRQSETS
jgi:hypothetical protein